jgi:hypothetical protein
MRPPRFSSNAESLRHDVQEFRDWRCHRDPVFNERFIALQKWQVASLKQRHLPLLQDPRYTDVTGFFLNEMYGGLDLTELADEVERALPIATRLMPDSVLGTAAIALQLNSLTGALDQRMAEILFEDMQLVEITEQAFCAAYRKASSREERDYQMELIGMLGLGLDKYVRSRIIYASFRLAHKPAQYAGLTALYGFLERGFEVMRPMGSARDFISAFIDVERKVIDNIWTGREDPFNP